MSDALRRKFTENAEQFDALMVEMLEENQRLRSALEELVNEPQPLGIDRPVYQQALRLIDD